MELLDSELFQDKVNSIVFGKVGKIPYLGELLSTKNDWSYEISIRIAKEESAFFALYKFLQYKILSEKTQLRLYTAIIRLTVTYYLWVRSMDDKCDSEET